MDLKNILKIGCKYTLVNFNNKGFVDYKHFILANVSYKKDSLGLKKYTLVARGSLTAPKYDKFTSIYSKQQYLIYQGYHKINTSVLVSRELMDSSIGHSMMKKRWPSYDGRYLHRIKDGMTIKPISEYIAELKPEQLIVYQCIS